MKTTLHRSQAILLGAVAIIAGLVTWLIVATIANFALRSYLSGYADVEVAMRFTWPMLIGRLATGALASAAAGVVVALVTRRRRVALGLALILAVFFLPAHALLWGRFPLWYHAVFFASLLILPPLGFSAVFSAMRPAPSPSEPRAP